MCLPLKLLALFHKLDFSIPLLKQVVSLYGLHLIAQTQSATVNLQSGYLQQWTFATMDISQHIQIPSGYLPEQTIARM